MPTQARPRPTGWLAFHPPLALDAQLRRYCIAQGVSLRSVMVEALERHLAALAVEAKGDPPAVVGTSAPVDA